MSLRFAILSMLSREALTGYDLTKRFETMVGFFWAAKHSQIYPELASLAGEGLVTFEVVAQVSKPNKKVYTLTQAGRSALARWIEEEPERRAVRDPLLMRVWALGSLPPSIGLTQLRDVGTEVMQRLQQVEEALAALPDSTEAEDRAIGMRLVLELGQRQYQVYRDWTEQAIIALNAAAPEPLS
jgi:PadR family transcriptional regulator AphA